MEDALENKFADILTFCEYYRPILVDEIALADHPAYIHYGKCSVIGMLASTGDALESLCIPDLPSDMQLPDGTFSVVLCLNNYYGIVPKGNHVEVNGILKLRDKTTGVSADAGVLRRVLLQKDPKELRESYSRMLANYIPFIEVADIHGVLQARELISCNLKIRKLEGMFEFE
uniref:Uncharacterized protein n=1 Tax=Anopheles dirus TaxID=7168 RepID=A0A182N221_9DIPT